ncbi:MAG: hypothetical protein ACOC2B_03430, partial [Sediminispirochaetaceae bacterium]
MKDLKDLREAIEQYDEGDLLAAADIRERAEVIYEGLEESELKHLLKDTIELFEEIILKGSEEGQENRLSIICKQLDAIIYEEEAGEKEPKETGKKES